MERSILIVFIVFLLPACKVSVSVQGNGAGVVSDNADLIECGNTVDSCDAKVSIGASMTLVATAAPENEFVEWVGECEGQGATCELSITGNVNTSAVFIRPDFEESPTDCDEQSANALCLEPVFSEEYYIDQSVKYFLTMDSSVSPFVQPNYSDLVVRWEWPPWLLLTGYERFNLIWTDIVLKLNPTSYALIDCQAFDTQPFGRCHVVFDYSGELCPIYEEFTFNDQGEITFIEAWTDMPGWLPMEEGDYWAEGNITKRLANRVPGLGNETGLIDWESEAMQDAAARDADVAELVKRANDPYRTWFQQLIDHSQELSEGCDPDHVGFELD